MKGWFSRLFRSARSQPLKDAQARRTEARDHLRQAEDRGDTREIGRRRMVLEQATRDELRAATPQIAEEIPGNPMSISDHAQTFRGVA